MKSGPRLIWCGACRWLAEQRRHSGGRQYQAQRTVRAGTCLPGQRSASGHVTYGAQVALCICRGPLVCTRTALQAATTLQVASATHLGSCVQHLQAAQHAHSLKVLQGARTQTGIRLWGCNAAVPWAAMLLSLRQHLQEGTAAVPQAAPVLRQHLCSGSTCACLPAGTLRSA